jgi:hypothetical protein
LMTVRSRDRGLADREGFLERKDNV